MDRPFLSDTSRVDISTWETLSPHQGILGILNAPYNQETLRERLNALAREILERFPIRGVQIHFPLDGGVPIHAAAGDIVVHVPPEQLAEIYRLAEISKGEPHAFTLSSSWQKRLHTHAAYALYIPLTQVSRPGFMLLVFDHPQSLAGETATVLTLYTHILAHVFADVQVLQDLHTLLEASRDLVESGDLSEVLLRLLHHAMDITDTEAASILLQDPRTGKLVFRAATGPHPDRLVDIEVPLNSIAGRALREERPIVIQDVSQAPEHFRSVDQATGFQTRSLIAVPLRWRERYIGVLEVLNKRDGQFDEHDLEMLQALAGQAAAVIIQAQLAEERKKALQELRQLDERKTQFMHLASHELRTPLTIIRGYAEMAEELLSQSPQPNAETWQTLQMLVAEILNGAKRMSLVVDEITRAAGTVPHPALQSLKPLDFREVVTWVLDELHSWIESKNLHVTVNLPDHPVTVPGDRDRLRDAVLHVIGNAVKFTPAHGEIEVILWTEESRALLSVSDTGPGIPPEEQKRIFEPFYQVENPLTRQHPGMGLGLTIARDVVEQHAGHIWVDSAPGQGSTFTIVLPLESTRSKTAT